MRMAARVDPVMSAAPSSSIAVGGAITVAAHRHGRRHRADPGHQYTAKGLPRTSNSPRAQLPWLASPVQRHQLLAVEVTNLLGPVARQSGLGSPLHDDLVDALGAVRQSIADHGHGGTCVPRRGPWRSF